MHSTAGFMVHAYMTCKYVFNLNAGDVLWNTGDCGWATGHTCLCYGPQLNGATALIYEGIPSYPEYGRMWQVCCSTSTEPVMCFWCLCLPGVVAVL